MLLPLLFSRDMKRRILIADNDEQLNRINAKVLTAAGIVDDLRIVNNGRDAINYLQHCLVENKPMPDIIIFDLALPTLDGFGLIDAYERLDFPGKEDIQLVVFTASSNPGDRQKAASRGIRHYVNKPYLLRNLKDIIMRSPRPTHTLS